MCLFGGPLYGGGGTTYGGGGQGPGGLPISPISPIFPISQSDPVLGSTAYIGILGRSWRTQYVHKHNLKTYILNCEREDAMLCKEEISAFCLFVSTSCPLHLFSLLLSPCSCPLPPAPWKCRQPAAAAVLWAAL